MNSQRHCYSVAVPHPGVQGEDIHGEEGEERAACPELDNHTRGVHQGADPGRTGPDATDLTKKQVSGVLDELSSIISRHLKKGGAGQFTVPGLLKIKTLRKPATKARRGINPFTQEETVFKAKPARTVVKVQPLKTLKDMAK